MQKIFNKTQLIHQDAEGETVNIEKANLTHVDDFIELMGLFYTACGFHNNLIVGVCTDSGEPDYHIEIKPHSVEAV